MTVLKTASAAVNFWFADGLRGFNFRACGYDQLRIG
jgi:hypothetical protein